jgi:hypothetical protein
VERIDSAADYSDEACELPHSTKWLQGTKAIVGASCEPSLVERADFRTTV